MTDDTKAIANKVRGIAAENRLNQKHIAAIIGIERKAVGQRFEGKVAFTGVEILRLSRATGVPIDTFFPATSPADVPLPPSGPAGEVLSSSPPGVAPPERVAS